MLVRPSSLQGWAPTSSRYRTTSDYHQDAPSDDDDAQAGAIVVCPAVAKPPRQLIPRRAVAKVCGGQRGAQEGGRGVQSAGGSLSGQSCGGLLRKG
jgi:hypothetical protein